MRRRLASFGLVGVVIAAGFVAAVVLGRGTRSPSEVSAATGAPAPGLSDAMTFRRPAETIP